MSSRKSFYSVAVLLTLCYVPFLSACSRETEPKDVGGSGGAGEVTVPMQPFFLSLMKSGGSLGGKVSIPAIWIFSAEGKLINLVSTEAELVSLQQSTELTGASAYVLTCEQVAFAVAEAKAAHSWQFDCGNGQAAALLLTNREVCKTCDVFEAEFSELGNIEPQRRQTLVLTQ